jgi:hypothetical protein
MVSLEIKLDEGMAEAVRQLAATQNRSESEIVQDALLAFVNKPRGLPKGTGQYHSGGDDGSEQARKILRGAVKEGKWP